VRTQAENSRLSAMLKSCETTKCTPSNLVKFREKLPYDSNSPYRRLARQRV
jgi:DNA-binding Xre family transcriptional regulator